MDVNKACLLFCSNNFPSPKVYILLGHSGKLVLLSKLGRRITLLHCLQWIMGMGGCYTDRNGSLLYFWNSAVELYGTGSENSCFLWDTNLY